MLLKKTKVKKIIPSEALNFSIFFRHFSGWNWIDFDSGVQPKRKWSFPREVFNSKQLQSLSTSINTHQQKLLQQKQILYRSNNLPNVCVTITWQHQTSCNQWTSNHNIIPQTQLHNPNYKILHLHICSILFPTIYSEFAVVCILNISSFCMNSSFSLAPPLSSSAASSIVGLLWGWLCAQNSPTCTSLFSSSFT